MNILRRWFATIAGRPRTCPFCGGRGAERPFPKATSPVWDCECGATGLSGPNPDALAVAILALLGLSQDFERTWLTRHTPGYMGPHACETMEEVLRAHAFEWRWSDWKEKDLLVQSIWVREKASAVSEADNRLRQPLL